MGGKGAALLVALLVAATVLAAIPSCSADANITTLPMKPKASPPPPVHTGQAVTAYFPLVGEVYPGQKFYVQMSFGNSPNLYSMDIDTGSDVLWVECQVPPQAVLPQPPMNKLIRCDDPLCKAVHASTGQEHECKYPARCDFKVTYHDGAFAEGVLIADTVALRLTSGSTIHPRVAIGCAHGHGVNPPPATYTDGVLGLRFGQISILSQLSSHRVFGNVLGHCLSSNSRGRGFLFLGDYRHPPSGVIWVPMTESKYFSPGPASVFWDSQPLGSSPSVWLDSGTPFTYFALQPFNNFIDTLIGYVSKQPLTRVYDDPSRLPYCWRGPRPFQSIADAQGYFKKLKLTFANGAASMELPPVNYLIISANQNACLGIRNGTAAKLQSDVTLIGGISFLDRLVIYDNDKKRIGWVSIACSRATSPLG